MIFSLRSGLKHNLLDPPPPCELALDLPFPDPQRVQLRGRKARTRPPGAANTSSLNLVVVLRLPSSPSVVGVKSLRDERGGRREDSE